MGAGRRRFLHGSVLGVNWNRSLGKRYPAAERYMRPDMLGGDLLTVRGIPKLHPYADHIFAHATRMHHKER